MVRRILGCWRQWKKRRRRWGHPFLGEEEEEEEGCFREKRVELGEVDE